MYTDLRVKDVVVCVSVTSHDRIHRIGIHWWLQWFQAFYGLVSPVGRELFWLQSLELLSCSDSDEVLSAACNSISVPTAA